jgi:hypothetical protein
MINLKSLIAGAAITVVAAGSLSAQLTLGPGQSSSAIVKQQAELAKARHEVRADAPERVADRRKIVGDRRELKGDKRELREDRRELRAARKSGDKSVKAERHDKKGR